MEALEGGHLDSVGLLARLLGTDQPCPAFAEQVIHDHDQFLGVAIEREHPHAANLALVHLPVESLTIVVFSTPNLPCGNPVWTPRLKRYSDLVPWSSVRVAPGSQTGWFLG